MQALFMLATDDTFIVDSTRSQQRFMPEHTPPFVIETITLKSLLMQL